MSRPDREGQESGARTPGGRASGADGPGAPGSGGRERLDGEDSAPGGDARPAAERSDGEGSTPRAGALPAAERLRAEDPAPGGDARSGAVRPDGPHYGRYVGLLAIVIVVLITINTIVTKPNGAGGIQPGQPLAPFAVPLATSSLRGDANIATQPDQGSAGSVPACSVRGPRVLNICELYERGPVVLALFIDSGSCSAVLGDLQSLSRAYPAVRFAAVAIKPDRGALRSELRRRGITLPVGVDEDGALVALYKDASCPQISFAYPGGTVQSRPLLSRPAAAELRARVEQLVSASRARRTGAASG